VLRIEGLADAVFGFALTLLVVSLEVPNTFDESCRASPSKRFCVADCEAGQLHCKPLKRLNRGDGSGSTVVYSSASHYWLSAVFVPITTGTFGHTTRGKS